MNLPPATGEDNVHIDLVEFRNMKKHSKNRFIDFYLNEKEENLFKFLSIETFKTRAKKKEVIVFSERIYISLKYAFVIIKSFLWLKKKLLDCNERISKLKFS